MSQIRGPGQIGPSPEIRTEEPLATSPLAEQVATSKEKLIESHLKEYKILNIPILGKFIKKNFGQLIAKRHYIKEIKQKFVKDAIKKDAPKEGARMVSNKHIEPSLKNMSIEDLQHVEKFIDSGGSLLFFERGSIPANLNRALVLARDNPSEMKKSFQEAQKLAPAMKGRSIADQSLIMGFLVRPACRQYAGELLKQYSSDSKQVSKALDAIVLAMRNYPEGVEAALKSAEDIFPMMGKRFTSMERLSYYESWVELAGQKEKKEFAKNFNEFVNFYEKAREIQAERPQIYLIGEKKGFEEPTGLYPWFGSMKHFLTGVCKEVQIETINTNTQMVHENLAAFFMPPGRHHRMRVSFDLEKRFNYDFSLSKEFHPDRVILEDGDEEIDLIDVRMRLFVTNEKTMETRALRLPIPIAGRMTKTEARKLFQLLEATVDNAAGFDEKYEELKLPAEQKEATKQAFLEWTDQAKRGLGALVLDFNPTPLRKEFSFAREQPEIAAALANPDDTGLLIEAAKQQNLFQLSDGRLSLLPPEIANPMIGEISDEAVKAAAAQLRSGKEEPKAEIDLPGGKGKVSFKVTEGMVQTAHVAWVETTISRDDVSYTHTTLLSLGEEEPIPAGQKIEEFIYSGLFERDLLLAKAEFMEHADRSQFADLAEALQPALKEVSYADRALLLNFMVGTQGRAYTLEILRQPPEQQIASAQDLLKALKNHPEIFDTIPPKADPAHLDAIAKVLNGNLAIIETRYNTHIRSALTDKSPSERALALNFLAHPSCKPYLERILKSDDLGLVAPAMEKIIRAMQANPQEIVAAMGTYPEIARMMGSRFAESDHFRYMDSWIELAGKTDPEEFQESFSTFKKYAEEAVRIQGDRPKIYSSYDFALSMEQLGRGEANIMTMSAMLGPIAEKSPFLGSVISEIQDSTLVSNTQMIHENIHCFLVPPDFSARTFPSLERRYSHSLALSREFHPDLTLYADSEDEIDFRASTDLAITNEKTMETRRMRLELPFSGRMTVTRARKLLMVLEETVKSPTRFDDVYEKAGLETEDKERIKKAFTEWEAKSTEELGKVIFDFNATETRPAFTYVRENPRMAAAISNPKSLSNALEAASRGNIFLMKNGRLSLLPEEIPQPKMGQIAPIEFGSAVEALLKGGKADLTLPKRLTEQIIFETGELSFSHYQEQVDEIQVVWLETKIARGSETTTRKTAYILSEGETASAKLEEIANSGQFERDLLLAKAEFIDAHV